MSVDDRVRLGHQLLDARRKRRWKLLDVARRTARQPSRISEIENGRANSAIDNITDAGHVFGLSLVFVPDHKIEEVMRLISGTPKPEMDTQSVFEELFIPNEDMEGPTHGGP